MRSTSSETLASWSATGPTSHGDDTSAKRSAAGIEGRGRVGQRLLEGPQPLDVDLAALVAQPAVVGLGRRGRTGRGDGLALAGEHGHGLGLLGDERHQAGRRDPPGRQRAVRRAQRVGRVGELDRGLGALSAAQRLETALGPVRSRSQVAPRQEHGQGEQQRPAERDEEHDHRHLLHALARPAGGDPVARDQHGDHRGPHAQRGQPGEAERVGPQQRRHREQGHDRAEVPAAVDDGGGQRDDQRDDAPTPSRCRPG